MFVTAVLENPTYDDYAKIVQQVIDTQPELIIGGTVVSFGCTAFIRLVCTSNVHLIC